MNQEKRQPANHKDEEEEEKYQHEASPYLVVHICGVEEAALREEVEGELLNISFKDYQKESSVEEILSYKFRNAIVEEESEGEREYDIDQNDYR